MPIEMPLTYVPLCEKTDNLLRPTKQGEVTGERFLLTGQFFHEILGEGAARERIGNIYRNTPVAYIDSDLAFGVIALDSFRPRYYWHPSPSYGAFSCGSCSGTGCGGGSSSGEAALAVIVITIVAVVVLSIFIALCAAVGYSADAIEEANKQIGKSDEHLSLAGRCRQYRLQGNGDSNETQKRVNTVGTKMNSIIARMRTAERVKALYKTLFYVSAFTALYTVLSFVALAALHSSAVVMASAAGAGAAAFFAASLTPALCILSVAFVVGAVAYIAHSCRQQTRRVQDIADAEAGLDAFIRVLMKATEPDIQNRSEAQASRPPPPTNPSASNNLFEGSGMELEAI